MRLPHETGADAGHAGAPAAGLRHGDVVEVKSAAEILATLDDGGALDGLPFMPEMVQFCGRRFVVDKRADKICDTIHYTGSRRLPDAVMLENLRCDGGGHDGCQAECRLFWKESWLRRVDGAERPPPPADGQRSAALMQLTLRDTKRSTEAGGGVETRYRCQATELTEATQHLKLWDPRPYLRECATGNVPPGRFLRVMTRAAVQEPMRKLGLIPEIHLPGTATGKEPEPALGLQPGEWVQVKSKAEIAATLNAKGRNRGLWFDREMMPYCGGTFRVRRRIRRFIDERNGKMIDLKTEAITLDQVVCSGDLSLRRWFCPREIYPYWRESWVERVGKPKTGTISFFGNFGTQNLGNEYTLKAMLDNVRNRLPGADINCICPDPADASARHGIPAFLMSYRYAKEYTSRQGRGPEHGAVRFLRRLLVRMPLELIQWIKAFRTLKGTSALVMTGTGMLGDFGIRPLDLHYEILKWSLIARLRGARVFFVSVGSGPIANPVSRWIVKAALRLANYRSYRDEFSKAYLTSIGFDTSRDFVFPDLAFSLRPGIAGRPKAGRKRIVGLGLMDYYGKDCSPESGESIYQAYVEKVVRLMVWLLDRDYAVRLLIGDISYDKRVRGDVIRLLREKRPQLEDGQIIDEPVSSVEDLLVQLADTDVVVATRFHNILLALMLNKPVVALSYHEKIAALMSAAGLGEFCQGIEQLDVDRLMQQFLELERRRDALKPVIERKTEEYGRALESQYAHLVDHLGSSRHSRSARWPR